MNYNYEILIDFLPNSNGKKYTLLQMTLITKKTSWKRAQEIAEDTACRLWPIEHMNIEIASIEISRLKFRG